MPTHEWKRDAKAFLRGDLTSSTSREAARRSIERGIRSMFIRMRRAGFTFTILLGALIVYAIGWGVHPLVFLLAIFAIAMLSVMVLFIPVRAPREQTLPPPPMAGGARGPALDRLTGQTEDWLLGRARALPRAAGPAVDRIVGHLRDLKPSLAKVPADSALGNEAQRLIGRHLPDLVETWLSLSPAERGAASVQSGRLAESLAIVADQLGDLCERIAEDRRTGFDVEHRFIATRYGDSGPGPGRD